VGEIGVRGQGRGHQTRAEVPESGIQISET
jgi:hypothetical protein